jgi:hypothetical protein
MTKIPNSKREQPYDIIKNSHLSIFHALALKSWEPFFFLSERRNHNILKEKSAYGKNWTRKRGRKSEI